MSIYEYAGTSIISAFPEALLNLSMTSFVLLLFEMPMALLVQ
jgi:hypothetical protein